MGKIRSEMSNVVRTIGVPVMFVLLVAVRYFSDTLFYDPLDDFFHGTFKGEPLPAVNKGLLTLSMMLRYLINTLLSMAIIYFALNNLKYLKFAAAVYAILPVVFVPFFLILLSVSETGDHMILFYARRVLIHPLLLFVLLPALYYQKKQVEKSN